MFRVSGYAKSVANYSYRSKASQNAYETYLPTFAVYIYVYKCICVYNIANIYQLLLYTHAKYDN